MAPIVAPTVQRIAVIGGGPLGLCTAKYLKAEQCFEQIDVFEQQDNFEGTWCYSYPNQYDKTIIPQTNPHQGLPPHEWRRSSSGRMRPILTNKVTSPMYEKLDTNLPKQIMQFSDFEFEPSAPLFPPREMVSSYINDYAVDIKHLVKLGTQVVDVQLQRGTKDSWLLTSQNLRSGAKESALYDAIAVCSGHYVVPYIPSHRGIEDWGQRYPGAIIHSKFYRSPELFKGKKVLVVGNAASGTDIASQILTVSKRPLVVSQRSESFLTAPGQPQDPMKKVVPEISRFLDEGYGHRAVEFVDGHIETGFDCVVFATGYLYNFPFLRNSQLDLIQDGMRIQNTYLHLFHREHETITFLGMPLRIVPFPLGEAQAAVVARVWSGRLNLPSKYEMAEWESKTIRESGDGRGFHVLNYPKDFHYQRMLYDWAAQASPGQGKLPKRWDIKEFWIRENVPSMKLAFAQCGDRRSEITSFGQLGFDFEEWQAQREREE